MSLRHVSLREMGWSRNPTSSGFCCINPESEGKATYGKFRKHAFLASQKLEERTRPAAAILAVRLVFGTPLQVPRAWLRGQRVLEITGESKWAIKKM